MNMLDIKFIRENQDIVKDAIRKKFVKLNLDDLIKLDDTRREVLLLVENLRAEQKRISDGMITADATLREALLSELRPLKEHVTEKEEELKKILVDWRELMLQVPNVPDITVPEGDSDVQNQETHVWGEKPAFSFEPKDHIEIMLALKMVDFERGTKVHGFRGYFLTGDGVKLCFAIWNYAMDFFGKRGFVPVIPPMIVRKQNLYGTGHLPGDVEDYYMTQDGDALVGTSEVPIMGMHADEILDKDIFPVKYLGFSPCYRREAGSYSKDVKGLIRVHEFYKFEQVVLCEASHEVSVRTHEELRRNTEEYIESLGIPYHTVINCGADLGLGQVKKYDIELWVPKEEKYREIASASYFHDFQTRRFNIRYKDGEGRMQYAHSLNNTAIPTPRILVSLIENFQEADGRVRVPEVLRTYMGKDYIG
jgi:seryl-tRNA synthetase